MPSKPVRAVEDCLGALKRVLVLTQLGTEHSITFYRYGAIQDPVTPTGVKQNLAEVERRLGDLRSGKVEQVDLKQLERESVGLEKHMFEQLKGLPDKVNRFWFDCNLFVGNVQTRATETWARASEHLVTPAAEHENLRRAITRLTYICSHEVPHRSRDGNLQIKQLEVLVKLHVEWEPVLRACEGERAAARPSELRAIVDRLKVLIPIYEAGRWGDIPLLEGHSLRELRSLAELAEDELSRGGEDDQYDRRILDGFKWTNDLDQQVLARLWKIGKLLSLDSALSEMLETALFKGDPPQPIIGRPRGDRAAAARAHRAELEQRIDRDRMLTSSQLERLADEAKTIQAEWFRATFANWPISPVYESRDKVEQRIIALAKVSSRWRAWERACKAARDRAHALGAIPRPLLPPRPPSAHAPSPPAYGEDFSSSPSPPAYGEDSLRHARGQLGLVTPRLARLYQL